jgi:hypothetical protein
MVKCQILLRLMNDPSKFGTLITLAALGERPNDPVVIDEDGLAGWKTGCE